MDTMTCPTCRGTGMGRIKDGPHGDETYPCGCDLGDPHRTRGELALRYLFDALPTMRKETP